MKYAIVDIETNGGVKITEISIFVFDGEKVIDEYTTLINPECNIPAFITNLTGITNTMVKEAPKFYEVAKDIFEATEDCVFVAHNVNFDYNIISKEFKELGLSYKRKKLCTVRLSRKLLPGRKSYSLGKLCLSEGIPLVDRHRARGDAEATTILFEKLLKADNGSVIASFLNPRSREATLPPLLPKKVFDNLPEKEGVYYFKNEDKEIIYVGKANNIKQRVLSHFYDKKKKEISMCMATADIDFTETGSELLALLLESSEIKKHFPKYNRAQRRTKEGIGLFYYEDRKGVLHLAWNQLKNVPNPIVKFYSAAEARTFVEKLCESHELCPKYCNLQTNVSSCFHYQIKQCKGVCREEETIENYNKRVKEAIQSLRFSTENFIIKESGRKTNEFAYALILKGSYMGFGYLEDSTKNRSTDTYLEAIQHQKDNKDVNRIITSYLKNNSTNLMALE
ncbi:exonuclease domain-containing protein [Flavicella sediminum]|uniref:exonuclease domain-containing protein n=1 Tax=Flavicella sediminum TaxID=2585141 RepID=UPI0011214C04|nr:exonuclease domain-containing protein [Flavicella sediminum]